tara:strand:+ start:200 stop:562 length:363 start_codon:yes stop_codon:yes gene_type:complete
MTNYDCGFDSPDTIHTYFDMDGKKVSISIVRHWYQHEDYDDPSFKVSYNITRAGKTTHQLKRGLLFFINRGRLELMPFPVDTTESTACEIAHKLYEQDDEVTEGYEQGEAIYEAERRMGA